MYIYNDIYLIILKMGTFIDKFAEEPKHLIYLQ
jgi:hypothetical protein